MFDTLREGGSILRSVSTIPKMLLKLLWKQKWYTKREMSNGISKQKLYFVLLIVERLQDAFRHYSDQVVGPIWKSIWWWEWLGSKFRQFPNQLPISWNLCHWNFDSKMIDYTTQTQTRGYRGSKGGNESALLHTGLLVFHLTFEKKRSEILCP